MKINQSNYEAYILDYLEGTISSEDEKLLLNFLDEHPEFKVDLEVPIDLILPSAIERTSLDKTQLKKHAADLYQLKPKEYLYIKDLEEGLTVEEKNELDLIQPNFEQQEKEKTAYSKTILKADSSRVFSYKKQLKRAVLIPLLAQRNVHHIAAAIAIALLVSIVWIGHKQFTPNSSNQIARVEQSASSITEDNDALEPKVFDNSIGIQKPVSKDSLLEIARDPMGNKKKVEKQLDNSNVEKTVSPKQKVQPNEPVVLDKLDGIARVHIDQHQSVNAYELALNVMMPQYLNNNILSREIEDMYVQLDDNIEPQKNMAFVENGVKILNFFSKDEVRLNKYYNDQGQLVGYNVSGNNVNITRKSK